MTDDTRTTIPTALDPGETLRQIQARADAATAGPWATYAAYGSRGVEVTDTEDMVFIADGGVTYAVNEPDADFTAHARQDVPALVGAIRAVLALDGPMTGENSGERYMLAVRTAITSALSEVRP